MALPAPRGRLTLCDHALVRARLTALRDRRTSTPDFRRIAPEDMLVLGRIDCAGPAAHSCWS